MKGIIRIVSLTMGLIMLFSVGLLAGTYALATVPAAAKDYEVDRLADEALFAKTEPGPARQSDLKEKFESCNTLENGVLTFFTKEQAEELHSRKENGELFTLSYDEVLFIISDSIRRYYDHDEIIMTNAAAYGLIPEEKTQNSPDHHVYCYHGDYSELSYEQARLRYRDIMDDIYLMIVYRLSMLDSSFARCEQYVTGDSSRWLIVNGQTPAVLVSGKGEYGLESINVDTLIPEKTFYLKSFAETSDLEAASAKTADEFGVFRRKAFAAISSKKDDQGTYEEWYNASLEAPLLIADFENRNHLLRIIQKDWLTVSTVFPTIELKEKAPVFDPAGEAAKKYDRTLSELMAKDLIPDCDVSIPTPAFPLKYYKHGISGDENGLRVGMTFGEMVEIYGLPYDGTTSGFLTMRYFTEEGKTIVLYFDPSYTADGGETEDYVISSIHWPEDIDG